MGTLINIDNGGTLTDFFALDRGKTYHTKSLTTPFDLSKCFFDGLQKLAAEIYGDASRVDELLQSTEYIRYSTTQGTNALVERKGPRLGLIVDNIASIERLKSSDAESSLFSDIVGDRIAAIDLTQDDEQLEEDVVKAVNRVAGQGAARIVLSIDQAGFKKLEGKVRRLISRKFPSHLLGVLPVLEAGDLVDTPDFASRTWTAIINSFLHPAMERFLYSADQRLGGYKTRNPLLIFRNDGGAARVAKTAAVKTYSSGPRGGMEGARSLAATYDCRKLLTYDVGGTSTDIGLVEGGDVSCGTSGSIEGVSISFPLADVRSIGLGGGSIIRVEDGEIIVGPESVGGAPGPACFGLGGKQATITDVFLLTGMLDPATYFGGELKLDKDRAENAVRTNVAEPLGRSMDETMFAMRNAWVGRIAESLKEYTDIDSDTTLAGFGGAGAFASTAIADAAGIKRLIIPGKSAVFSAYGINFSPLSHQYQASVENCNKDELTSEIGALHARAGRDFFAEGIDIADCELSIGVVQDGQSMDVTPLLNGGKTPSELRTDEPALIEYRAAKNIDGVNPEETRDVNRHKASVASTRNVMIGAGERKDIPVFNVSELDAGAFFDGPAVIEDAFFTGFVDAGWRVEMSGNLDLVLTKAK